VCANGGGRGKISMASGPPGGRLPHCSMMLGYAQSLLGNNAMTGTLRRQLCPFSRGGGARTNSECPGAESDTSDDSWLVKPPVRLGAQ
jgi:hypothetical protein